MYTLTAKNSSLNLAMASKEHAEDFIQSIFGPNAKVESFGNWNGSETYEIIYEIEICFFSLQEEWKFYRFITSTPSNQRIYTSDYVKESNNPFRAYWRYVLYLTPEV